MYVRRVDSSVLVFSLSSHRHSYIGLFFIDLIPSFSCHLQLTHQNVFTTTFFIYFFVHTHREVSGLDNDVPEESSHFRFLRTDCLDDIKGSVGLILTKASDLRIYILCLSDT